MGLFLVDLNVLISPYLISIVDCLKLTFHSPRHTFATTVTLTNGVPIETVSKMLGHNNIKTTQIYPHVIDSKVSSDMLKLRQKFI